MDNVIRYIQNQEIHHQKKTFLQEYKEMLDAFGIDYDDRFIFKPVELEWLFGIGSLMLNCDFRSGNISSLEGLFTYFVILLPIVCPQGDCKLLQIVQGTPIKKNIASFAGIDHFLKEINRPGKIGENGFPLLNENGLASFTCCS